MGTTVACRGLCSFWVCGPFSTPVCKHARVPVHRYKGTCAQAQLCVCRILSPSLGLRKPRIGIACPLNFVSKVGGSSRAQTPGPSVCHMPQGSVQPGWGLALLCQLWDPAEPCVLHQDGDSFLFWGSWGKKGQQCIGGTPQPQAGGPGQEEGCYIGICAPGPAEPLGRANGALLAYWPPT